MGRTLRPNGRGTRYTSGKISGVSPGYFIENPSGAKQLVSGVSAWAGTTVTLVTGLNSIDALVGSIENMGSGTSALLLVTSNINNNPGCASASIRYNIGLASSSIASIAVAETCEINFLAFGT